MIRKAFKMKLRPGCLAEYKKRHDEIWPELAKAHADAGISDYSIYFDEETLILFGSQKLTDDNTAGDLANLGIVQKWWDFNKDIMETHSNNMPTFKPLVEIFHMD